MTTTFASNTKRSQARASFEEQIECKALASVEQFKRVTRAFALFHMLFFALGTLELFAFLLFFSFLTKSTMLAFSLAALLLTGFSYFVLLFYFQAKKPEQLTQIRKAFLNAASGAENHLQTCQALYQLIDKLQHQEYKYYRAPSQTLGPLVEKLSVWTHWKDLHQMKESLLLQIVQELVEAIKEAPIDLQVHASLAQAHRVLSRLYTDPRRLKSDQPIVWVSPEYASPEMQGKRRTSAQRAIEEFKILHHFSPQDPWIYAQLADMYKDLDMPAEELAVYEELLSLTPNDAHALFRLGVLYFQEGYIARGLQVYQQLKEREDPNAATLIAHYTL